MCIKGKILSDKKKNDFIFFVKDNDWKWQYVTMFIPV